MTTRIWFDFSDARPPAAAIRQTGAVGVIRYGCPYADPKRADRAEMDSYRNVGLDERLVFETTADRLYTSGAAGGAADGPWFESFADELGYPRDYPLYYAADFNAGPGTWPAIDAYLRAARRGRPVGIYGPGGLIMAMCASGAADVKWQAGAATSWYGNGALQPSAHFYQRRAGTIVPAGWQVDENVQMNLDVIPKPSPVVTPPAPTPKPTPPKEIEVFVARCSQPTIPAGATPSYWLVGAGPGKVHLASMADVVTTMKMLGQTEVALLDLPTLQSMPAPDGAPTV